MSDPATDPVVYEEPTAGFTLSLEKTASGRFILITGDDHATSEVRVLDADEIWMELSNGRIVRSHALARAGLARLDSAQCVLAVEVRASDLEPLGRRMAGALVDVGRGTITAEELKQMIDGKVSGAVSRSMPPQGLCLVEVKYADFPPLTGE